MGNITVDLNSPSPYAEPDSKLYRFKRKLTVKTILKWVKAAAKGRQTFSLLEIGTGSGFLMSFLESQFPNAKLRGIEYDPRLVTIAQSKIKNAKISQCNAEEFYFAGEQFDIIVSLQVIEHLYQPDRMFDAVRKHLRPDGVFIFTTPNLGGLGARVMKSNWHAFSFDHVSLKSFDDWKAAAERRGFSSIYCGSTFFSGIPWMNRLPLALLNWGLLLTFGAWRWKHGESFVGVFRHGKPAVDWGEAVGRRGVGVREQ